MLFQTQMGLVAGCTQTTKTHTSLRSLICAFLIRFLGGIKAKLAKCKISRF